MDLTVNVLKVRLLKDPTSGMGMVAFIEHTVPSGLPAAQLERPQLKAYSSPQLRRERSFV